MDPSSQPNQEIPYSRPDVKDNFEIKAMAMSGDHEPVNIIQQTTELQRATGTAAYTTGSVEVHKDLLMQTKNSKSLYNMKRYWMISKVHPKMHFGNQS